MEEDNPEEHESLIQNAQNTGEIEVKEEGGVDLNDVQPPQQQAEKVEQVVEKEEEVPPQPEQPREEVRQPEPIQQEQPEKQNIIHNDQIEAVQNCDYTVQKEDMIKAVKLTQEREQCEEVDFLINKGRAPYIINGLCVDLKQGIKEESVEERTVLYGTNEFPMRPPKSFMELVVEALDDLTMQILIVCAIVSIVINFSTGEDPKFAWIEGTAILMAVTACTLVAAGNDYQKEKQFIELNQVADDKKKITVKRNGIDKQLHSKFLVCGDLVKIQEGMNIPCDGFIVKGIEVTTDESAMTGETDAIRKASLEQCEAFKNATNRIDYEDSLRENRVPSPVLLSGTKIMSGEGYFICIVVGVDSCSGKIRATLAQEDEDEGTPLQGKLEILATDISIFGLIGASITVFFLTCLWVVRIISSDGWTFYSLKALLDYFVIGVAVIVMAVPEGLPLAVTLSLAFSVKKMLKDQNLVRKLYACETMGGANCICSDKTGTLTCNQMYLVSVWNRKTIDFDHEVQHDLKAGEFSIKSQKCRHLLTLCMCCNSSANLGKMIIDKEGNEKPAPDQGNQTEIALLRFCRTCNVKYRKLREDHTPENGIRYPFSSTRKRMSTQVKYQGENFLLIKGASEYILGSCSNIHYWDTDEIKPMTEALKGEIKDAIHGMAKKTLRTLCLAYKKIEDGQNNSQSNAQGVYDIETEGFTLMVVTGIRDVLRPTVKESVRKCQIAGIKVRMVTGDNKVTAEAIAKDCGIIKDYDSPDYISNEHVWVGKQFWEKIEGIKSTPKMKDDEPVLDKFDKPVLIDSIKNIEAFNEIYEKIDVVARCRPEDKYAMVIGLITNRNCVAVTGDGTNDAPALKKADVGFAMGNAGTEVAREAADIILLDDNFTSIVQAVKWGRNIFDSVRKFLQFQLTINVVAVFIVFISALWTQEAILTTVQMLWVNMIMDTFAALALATEPPHEKLLKRQPHNRDSYIVTLRMLKHIVIQAIFQSIILLILTFKGDSMIKSGKNDSDTEVQERFIDGGGWDQVWDNFNHGDPQNPYDTKEQMIRECPIVATIDGYIRSGRAYTNWGIMYEYEPVNKVYGPSVHMTIIFNVFVFLQIFNFVNARKIEDEVNVLEDITASTWFVAIVGLIIFLQVSIVQFGYRFLNVSKGGLNFEQWMICLAIGSVGLIVSVLTKLVTPKKIEKTTKSQIAPLPAGKAGSNKGSKANSDKYSV